MKAISKKKQLKIPEGKITYSDFTEAHQLFNTLVGLEVGPRKEFILENYKNVHNLDI